MDFFREWIATSAEYIFAPENQELFFDKHEDVLIHQNLFHEQYFAAALIKKHDMRDQVKVMHKDAMRINQGLDSTKPRYTHLWGTTKGSVNLMSKVRISLMDMDLELFKRVQNFCKKNEL